MNKFNRLMNELTNVYFSRHRWLKENKRNKTIQCLNNINGSSCNTLNHSDVLLLYGCDLRGSGRFLYQFYCH